MRFSQRFLILLTKTIETINHYCGGQAIASLCDRSRLRRVGCADTSGSQQLMLSRIGREGRDGTGR